jgi:hypothetical protein
VIKLVTEHGDKGWVVLAPYVATRTTKQIREHWHNHLDSRIKMGPWTDEEDRLIILAQKLHGNHFAEIPGGQTTQQRRDGSAACAALWPTAKTLIGYGVPSRRD